MQVGDKVRIINNTENLSRIMLTERNLLNVSSDVFIKEYFISVITIEGKIYFSGRELRHYWFRDFNLELITPKPTKSIVVGDKVRVLDNERLSESINDMHSLLRSYPEIFDTEYTVNRIETNQNSEVLVYFEEVPFYVKQYALVIVSEEIILQVGMFVQIINNQEDLRTIGIREGDYDNLEELYFTTIRQIESINHYNNFQEPWFTVTTLDNEPNYEFRKKNLKLVNNNNNMEVGDIVKIVKDAHRLETTNTEAANQILNSLELNGSNYYEKDFEIIRQIGGLFFLNDNSGMYFHDISLTLVKKTIPFELPTSYKKLTLEQIEKVSENTMHYKYWSEIEDDIKKYYRSIKVNSVKDTSFALEFQDFLKTLFDGLNGHAARTAKDIKRYAINLLANKEKLTEWITILKEYESILAVLNTFIKPSFITDAAFKSELYLHRQNLFLFDVPNIYIEKCSDLKIKTKELISKIDFLKTAYDSREKVSVLKELIKEIESLNAKVLDRINELNIIYLQDRKKLLTVKNQKTILQKLIDLQKSKKKVNNELQELIDEFQTPIRSENLTEMYKNVKTFLLLKNEKDAKTNIKTTVRTTETRSANIEIEANFPNF